MSAIYEGITIDNPPTLSSKAGIPTQQSSVTSMSSSYCSLPVLSNRHDYEQPTHVPANVLTDYYVAVTAIKDQLKRTENWYYITLKLYNSVWTIVVLLVEDLDSMTSPPPLQHLHLVVEYWSGQFDNYAGVGVNFLYHLTVMSGVSIGEEHPRRDDAGTLGGLIRGKSGGRLLGVTLGHLFFHSLPKDVADRLVNNSALRAMLQLASCDLWEYTFSPQQDRCHPRAS